MNIFIFINSVFLICTLVLLAWDVVEKKIRLRNLFRLLFIGVLFYAVLYDNLHWSLYLVSYLAVAVTFTFKDLNEENN